MPIAAARAWNKDTDNVDAETQSVLTSPDFCGQVFGQDRHGASQTAPAALFAPAAAHLGLPDISSLNTSLPIFEVGREQGWLNAAIPAPERMLSDLFPVFKAVGLEDKEWAKDTTPHQIAFHYIQLFDEWTKNNKYGYSIDAKEDGYHIEITSSLDKHLKCDMYIAPVELLLKLVWSDYFLCDFVAQGLVLLMEEIGIDGPGYWMECYSDNKYETFAENDEEVKYETEFEPAFKLEENLLSSLLYRDISRDSFKASLNVFGLDPFWKDWGENLLQAIEEYASLSFESTDSEDEYDCGEEAMPFSSHFLVAHSEGDIWDFINEDLRERIGNFGFESPSTKIDLHKSNLDTALKTMNDVSNNADIAYNIGETIALLYYV